MSTMTMRRVKQLTGISAMNDENATANCKHAYAAKSNRWGVCIPDALLCKHMNCTNPDHIAAIDDFYQSINRSLIASSAAFW